MEDLQTYVNSFQNGSLSESPDDDYSDDEVEAVSESEDQNNDDNRNNTNINSNGGKRYRMGHLPE